MFPFRVTVIILVLSKCTYSQITTYEMILDKMNIESHDENASECIMKIAKKDISCGSVAFVISSDTYNDYLLRLINGHHCFSVIARSFKKNSWLVYPDVYIITVNNANEFSKGIRQLSKDLSWSPNVKFIIYLKEFTLYAVREIFEELLRAKIYNIVLVTGSDNNGIEIYTYYPYQGNRCGRRVGDIRSLGRCSMPNEVNLFPHKVTNGLRNCTIVVAAKEDIPFVILNRKKYSKHLKTGVEQFVLNTIAAYEGFNIKYISIKEENTGVVLPNGTITGLMGYLDRKEVDIVVGGLFLLGNRLEAFDTVTGYGFATYSLYTPDLAVSKWSKFYQQFNVSIWILIYISSLFTVLVVSIIRTLTSGKSNDECLLILKLWKYFCGQTDVGLFRNRYLRRVLIFWLIFTNLIYVFYNVALCGYIALNVHHNKKIDLNNIESLPLKPCIRNSTRNIFLYAYNEVFPKDDDSHKCQNLDEVFDRLTNRTDLFTIDTDYAYYLRFKYLNVEGRTKIHKNDIPRSVILAMYFNKGFPLLHKFQNYADRMHENELIPKQIPVIFTRKDDSIQKEQNNYTAICLKDFKLHFTIWFVGVTISFIRFVIEYKTGSD